MFLINASYVPGIKQTTHVWLISYYVYVLTSFRLAYSLLMVRY
jgi:hypothetical protein